MTGFTFKDVNLYMADTEMTSAPCTSVVAPQARQLARPRCSASPQIILLSLTLVCGSFQVCTSCLILTLPLSLHTHTTPALRCYWIQRKENNQTLQSFISSCSFLGTGHNGKSRQVHSLSVGGERFKYPSGLRHSKSKDLTSLICLFPHRIDPGGTDLASSRKPAVL